MVKKGDKYRMGFPVAATLRVDSYKSYVENASRYVLYELVVTPTMELLDMYDSHANGGTGTAPAKTDTSEKSSVSSSSWTLFKRFSDFVALDSYLHERFSNVPQLPSKTLTRSFEFYFLEKRRLKLDAYVSAISKRRDIMSSGVMHGFLKFYSFHEKYFESIPQRYQANCVTPSKINSLPGFGATVSALNYLERNDALVVATVVSNWTSSIGSQISLWTFKSSGTAKMESVQEFPAKVRCMAVSIEGDHLFAGNSIGEIHQLSISPSHILEKENTAHFTKGNAGIEAMAYSQHSKLLFTAGDDFDIHMHDLSSKAHSELICGPSVRSLCFLERDKLLFVGCSNGHISFFDISKASLPLVATFGESIRTVKDTTGHSNAVTSLHLDFNSKRLFSGGLDRYVCIWDLNTIMSEGNAQLLLPKIELASPILCMCWSKANSELLCGCRNGIIAAVDPEKHMALFCFDAHVAAVTCMYWDDDKRQLYTGSKDKMVHVWNFYKLAFEHSVDKSNGMASQNTVEEAEVENIPIETEETPKKVVRPEVSFTGVELSNFKSTVKELRKSEESYKVDPLLGIVVTTSSGGSSASAADSA